MSDPIETQTQRSTESECESGLSQSQSLGTTTCWETIDVDQNSEFEGLVMESVTEFSVVSSKVLGVGKVMTVGRCRECEFAFPLDRRMSREHFAIKCASGYAMVRDLGSTNGLFVNGSRVEEATIFDGEMIIAGTTVLAVRLIEKAARR